MVAFPRPSTCASARAIGRANISRARCASSSAEIKRRCALSKRFFARRNFSFVASTAASVRNILDADFFVGSRPICFFC